VSSQLGTEFKRSKYRLLGLVGQGQFGQVFCAVHRKTGRLVALKNLEQRRFPTHKFLRELRFLLSLQHRNIVTCHALEHTTTGRYLVMDYCEGGTLRTLMNGQSSLNLIQSLGLVADILAGIEHAHSRGIVHCDIKPENILLNLHPDGWVARVSDFGIARLSQEIADHDLGNTGSPAYMAPERFYGQYWPTSDVYAVGILLFELLAGYRPFSGTPGELMSAHLNQPVKIPPEIPDVCRPIILKALQKLSGRRYRTAGGMLNDLRDAIALLNQKADVKSRVVPLIPPLESEQVPLPQVAYRWITREALEHPIAWMVCDRPSHDLILKPLTNEMTASLRVCRVRGQQFEWQSIQEDSTVATSLPHPLEEPAKQPSTSLWHEMTLPSIAHQIWLCPQGCFVMMQGGFYLLPTHALKEGSCDVAALQPIISLPENSSLAIATTGHWCAIATPIVPPAGQTAERLVDPSDVLALPELELPGEKTWNTNYQIQFSPLPGGSPRFLATNPLQFSATKHPYCLHSLIALDSRHIIVISKTLGRLSSESNQRIWNGMSVELCSRRGQRLGTLNLPVRLKETITTSKPYQLLAIEQARTTSVLLIDLRPYRMLRIDVKFPPVALAAYVWGYVVAGATGQLLVMDLYGEPIALVDGPMGIMAIAPFGDYELFVSCWQKDHGYLYRINLKQLDLDLLF
jgi:serine/threonine-protein kinase